MHYRAYNFIATVMKRVPLPSRGLKIVEIGSLDINGTVRTIFNKHPVESYIGVDVGEGEGVDMVRSGDEVDLPDNSMDIVVSAECFEHNPKWRETFVNMRRMLRPGGLFILTCASTGRAEHGTAATTPGDSPLTLSLWGDYYRNLTEDDLKPYAEGDKFSAYRFYYNASTCDLYFVGIKSACNDAPAFYFEDHFTTLDVCRANFIKGKLLRIAQLFHYHIILRRPLPFLQKRSRQK